MEKKKILLWSVVIVFVVGFVFLFVKIFSFDNKDGNQEVDAYYPKIDDDFVDALYSYIPSYDQFGRTTMYGFAYTKYQNLAFDVVQEIIYNYIIHHDEFKLLSLTNEELIAKGIAGQTDGIKALHKISLEDFESVGKLIFGSNEKLPRTGFSISNKIHAQFIDEDGYYVYEKNLPDKEMDFIVERVYSKYVIANNNNTILIYDYYIKCEKDSTKCYDDEKKTKPNNYIKNNQGGIYLKNKLQNAQQYMHTFKFENGHYHWYSSELVSKK